MDTNKDFIAAALNRLAVMRGTMSADEIRSALESYGIRPAHPNAWGAMIRTAIKQAKLFRTADYVKSQRPGSNGRRVAVYVI